MDPNFDQEKHASILREYRYLFNIRDKLLEEKKNLEDLAKIFMREKEAKGECYRIIKKEELYIGRLKNMLVETNRKNRLLEEFIEKSLVNQEKDANDKSKDENISKVLEDEITGNIGK